ncbi:protein FAR-RED IMPAIRED RESPONSE 1-like [Chenopodium quinoa]|uniref:protein FAR-RED IMPAIRED RESPONSE 1-like n=1 Tax=Chenopodium quinoa TaxID=63459 RepID=UPI000B76FEFF|nr:protein FAR-RED IMPAIRED RESPONSE 1-like [Chenopodium quinoa]
MDIEEIRDSLMNLKIDINEEFDVEDENRCRETKYLMSAMNSKNVMFGCDFIADEKIKTFEWLLSTFKKSMGRSEPASIFTDQDMAMSKAIEKTCWNDMIEKYKLQNNRWFKRLYNLREKWCTTLSKDFFSAGILSSQRSESTNNAVRFKANKNTSLTDFFKIFNQTVKRWRKNESDADFKCSNSQPSSNLPFFELLKHASEVYTQTIFRYFETKFLYSIGCLTRLHSIMGNFYFYEVQIEYDELTKQKVTYNYAENTIACSCKNFEEVGWLCYHCIKILQNHNVTRIPTYYILTRWTKIAKEHVWTKRDEMAVENETQTQKFMPWRHMMARKSYSLVLKCQEHKETRNLMEAYLKMIEEKEEEFIKELEKRTERRKLYLTNRQLHLISQQLHLISKQIHVITSKIKKKSLQPWI